MPAHFVPRVAESAKGLRMCFMRRGWAIQENLLRFISLHISVPSSQSERTRVRVALLKRAVPFNEAIATYKEANNGALANQTLLHMRHAVGFHSHT